MVVSLYEDSGTATTGVSAHVLLFSLGFYGIHGLEIPASLRAFSTALWLLRNPF